jgi:Domain of unknown function (DUF222)
MFETRSPVALIEVLEDCHRRESAVIAARMSAIRELLRHRTAEAEDSPAADDPGYAVITGFARTAAEVAAVMNLAPLTASTMVGHAEALDTRLPEIAALLAQGRIDWRTTHLLISRTELVDREMMPMLDRLLADRIEAWQSWSRRRVVNAVDAAVHQLDSAGVKERRVAADTARHVTVSSQPNGMAHLRGTLPATAAAVFDRRLTELAGAVCPADPRTLDQRRADALVALGDGRELTCECTLRDCPRRVVDGPARPSRFVINVIATEDTVFGRGARPGYLDGYGVIDADEVRRLADHAAVRTVGEPSADGAAARSYQPGAALARFVRCRDLTCRFPGCDRPAWRADIDHTVPFDHADPRIGGQTTPRNTKCYCREHHRLKTFHGGPAGWRDEQLSDGNVVLTSPTGRVYRTTPAGVDLFPDLAPACAEPKPRRRSRRREKAADTSRRRNELQARRTVNAETRRCNRARAHEIDLRAWRNDVRRRLLVFKGGHPSTSPWCTWANDHTEDQDIGADWLPPPPTHTDDGAAPPF